MKWKIGALDCLYITPENTSEYSVLRNLGEALCASQDYGPRLVVVDDEGRVVETELTAIRISLPDLINFRNPVYPCAKPWLQNKP